MFNTLPRTTFLMTLFFGHCAAFFNRILSRRELACEGWTTLVWSLFQLRDWESAQECAVFWRKRCCQLCVFLTCVCGNGCSVFLASFWLHPTNRMTSTLLFNFHKLLLIYSFQIEICFCFWRGCIFVYSHWAPNQMLLSAGLVPGCCWGTPNLPNHISVLFFQGKT